MKLISKMTLLAVIVSFASSVQAQAPSATEILARYIKETGGQEAYSKIKSYQMKSKFIIAAANAEFQMEMIGTLGPNQMYSAVDLGQFGGKTERVVTPKICWEKSLQGTRKLEGAELAQNVREANLVTELKAAEMFAEMKVAGVENVDGEDCYKVTFVPKPGEGKPIDAFYSVKTGLKKKTSMTVASPQGEIGIQAISSDYREVDGIKMPFKTVQKLSNGMTFQMVTEKIDLNVEVDPAKFAVPDQLK